MAAPHELQRTAAVYGWRPSRPTVTPVTAEGLHPDPAPGPPSPAACGPGALSAGGPGPGRVHLHLGVHKTGTTWLQRAVFPAFDELTVLDLRTPMAGEWLRQLVEEDRFDPTPLAAWLDQARADGRAVLVSHEGLSGWLWAGHDLDRNLDRLVALVPDAACLLVVRNQADQLRALHGQYVSDGGTLSLARFAAGDRFPGTSLRFHARRLAYDHVADAIADRFGESSLWLEPYERVLTDRDAFIVRLATWIGVVAPPPDVRAALVVKRHNVSLAPGVRRLLRVWNWVGTDSYIHQGALLPAVGLGRVGRSVAARIRHLGDRSLPGDDRRTLHDATVAAHVATGYAPSNDRLQDHVDTDLRPLGYATATTPTVLGK